LTDGPTAPGSGRRLPDLGPRGEGWVIGQLALLALLVVVSLPQLPTLWPAGGFGWARLAAGSAAIAIGGWSAVRGLTDLGESLTPMPRPRADGRLIESGIYARLRHPIYAGLMLASIGWSVLTASLPAFLVALLLAAFLDAKARREEAWLLDRYPGYWDYRRRSKRFVPGIY
jgi:protein-S-isoprenylcysteine O-methyltransferase Ste14